MNNKPLYPVRSISNLKEMLNTSAELYNDKAAFLVKEKPAGQYIPVSFKQFKKDIDAFGTALLNLGLKGKRIAVIGENRYEWAVTYLSTVNGTGIIVPVDKELPENEIESLLLRAKVNAIVFSPAKKEQILKVKDKLDFIEYFICMEDVENEGKTLSFKKLLKEGTDLIKDGNQSFINSEIDNEAMNMLLFTSATTDKSKAVMLSHKNICSDLMDMCSMLYLDDKDVFLSVLPIHHTYECTCGFLCQIYRGCTIAYCEGLRHIPKNLQESKTTVMLGVPLIFESMYRRIWEQASKKPGMTEKLKKAITLSNFLKKFNIDITKRLFSTVHESFGGSLRLFISGAAGIDPLVAKGFRDLGINFVQGYGLTECSPIIALNRDVDFKDAAAGLPLPNVEIKIDNPNSEGIGEIIAKGPGIMLGYYENPEMTAKVLKDGWFYTGDMGYIDKEKFVHITGRVKNVIVTKNGKNIFPEEIEILLNRSQYIKESIVYGKSIKNSDDVAVAAAIVPEVEKIKEELQNEAPSNEAIYDFIHNEVKTVNKTLVNYMYIKDFHIREQEFVKTTTQKVKRYLVNEA